MMWWQKKKSPNLIEVKFVPLADITAYELSMIVLNTQGVNTLSRIPVEPDVWKNLDPALKRHFEAAPNGRF